MRLQPYHVLHLLPYRLKSLPDPDTLMQRQGFSSLVQSFLLYKHQTVLHFQGSIPLLGQLIPLGLQ